MKKVGRNIITIVLAVCMTLLAACGGNGPGTGTVKLISAESAGKGAAAEQLGSMIAEKLAASDAGITAVHHPNGELGGDADLLRQVGDGDISLMICQPAPAVSFIPELAVFDLPMAFAGYSAEQIDAVLNGPSDFHAAMQEAFGRAGYQLLGFMQGATYRLTTAKKPLRTLSDFRHLQIRTMENNNHMQFWSAIGAEPTPLAWAEVYFALQSGTIDAQENAADTCLGANFQEVQDYLCCTDHILYVNVVLMNKPLYDSLDETQRGALESAVSSSVAEMNGKLAEIDAESKASLVAGGMELIEYDPAFFDEIRELDAVLSLYSAIDEQSGGLASVLTDSLENTK